MLVFQHSNAVEHRDGDVDCRPRWWPKPHKGLFETLMRGRDSYVSHLRRYAQSMCC
jgi:hypothetical protein